MAKPRAGRCVRFGCRRIFGPEDDIDQLTKEGWQILDNGVNRCPEHRKEDQ